MKIVLINGSPKQKDSVSDIILTALAEKIGAGHECTMCNAIKQDKQAILSALSGANAIVFAFPLYVDGVPSHLLKIMDEIHHDIGETAPGAMVYTIVNNGFYEGEQNAIALEIMRNFSVDSGLTWGQGMGIGAGGMIGAAPVGYGPMKNLGNALEILALNITEGKSAEDRFIRPNFPRFLYKTAAHIGWRQAGKKGVDLYARPQIESY